MTQKLYQSLVNGETLTSKQIRSRFGIKNPRDAVYRLRHIHGVVVDSNQEVNSKGVLRHKYALGNPSPKLIAAGYRAMTFGL